MEKKIIIAIGRQFGSGGKAVAEVLGTRLGIPVYDNELIIKAAQDSGFSVELFRQSDEKKRFFSLSTLLSGGYQSDNENYMNDRRLFKIQGDTIRKIAEQGSAVIVGRCSDYILREDENAISVFITSPAEVRAERVAARTGLDLEKAHNLINAKDKGRAQYYNYYTFGEWGMGATYDLCIDSSILGIEGTADFIIDFCKKAGKL